MKDGFLKAAAFSPALRVADCTYNAQQMLTQLQTAAQRGDVYKRQPLACHASALPAELIPHNFPEVETSGKEILKQETFYEVQSWGCVSALLGLPAELIPHKFQKQASGMENL